MIEKIAEEFNLFFFDFENVFFFLPNNVFYHPDILWLITTKTSHVTFETK